MHDEIIRYSMGGEMTAAHLENHKQQMIDFLETQMKSEGVLPSLDLFPSFTTHYNHSNDSFEFTLSVYGIYVGTGEELWPVAGLSRGKMIMKHTPPTKLTDSLNSVEFA